MRMEVNNFSTNRLLLSSSPVAFPVLLCCFLSSLMGQSPLLRKAHLFETGISLVWSLMAQSPLLHKAHLLETCLSLVWSLMGPYPLLHAQCSFAGGGPLSGPESHGSVSSVVRGSLARDGPLSDPESHGSVSSVVRGSLARDGPLSDPESHGSVSPVAQCSFARDGPLSGLESHGSVSSVAQGSFAGDDSFSGLESLTLIALSCYPQIGQNAYTEYTRTIYTYILHFTLVSVATGGYYFPYTDRKL